MALRLETLPTSGRTQRAAFFRSVEEIRNRAAYELTNQFGSGHWSGLTQTPRLKREAKRKTLYVVHAADDAVATMALSPEGPGFLRDAWFAEPGADALYLTALAVLPHWQRQGIGRWCIEKAMELVDVQQATALRFDAYDAAAGAREFYVRCGCTERRRFGFNGCRLIAFERLVK